MSMTNIELLKAIGLMAKIEPSRYSFDGHSTAVMYKDPEKYLDIIEKWWEENKPETNAEWVKKKLEEIGYEVNLQHLLGGCPPPKSDDFYDKSCDYNCDECRKWWNECHVGD